MGSGLKKVALARSVEEKQAGEGCITKGHGMVIEVLVGSVPSTDINAIKIDKKKKKRYSIRKLPYCQGEPC